MLPSSPLSPPSLGSCRLAGVGMVRVEGDEVLDSSFGDVVGPASALGDLVDCGDSSSVAEAESVSSMED